MRPSVPPQSKLVLGFIVFSLLSGPRGARADGKPRSFVPSGYACAWHDEFGGAVGEGQPPADVDEASWTFQELAVNNEAQAYTTRQCRTRPDSWNTCVADGRLTLRARREESAIDCAAPNADCAPHFGQRFHATAPYTSARLMTKHKVHFPDGYLEFRVRLPEAERAGPPESGLWPAVWLLGENINEGPPPGDVKWPACGEIDIMEWQTSGGVSKQGWNAIWLGPGGTNACTVWPQGGNAACGPCPTTGGECVGSVTVGARHEVTGWTGFDHHGWHTYGFKWENTGSDATDQMIYFIDGVKMGVVHLGAELHAFKKDMFLTINLALGGMLGGPIQITDWERASLDVDYVRWYRKGDVRRLRAREAQGAMMNRPLVRQLLLVALLVPSVGGCAKKKAAVDPVERGRVAYAKYCATCHGVQANGYIADNAPSLRTTTFLSSASDWFLRDGIGRGRPGTAMAGYGRSLGGPLGPEDVNGIIAFLRVGGPPRVELLARPAAVTPRPARSTTRRSARAATAHRRSGAAPSTSRTRSSSRR